MGLILGIEDGDYADPDPTDTTIESWMTYTIDEGAAGAWRPTST